MADYLATALVRVRPDTKNFTTELRADLKKRISTIKLTVPIRADLKTFHQQVNRELKANPIKIPVVPDMTGFQAELRKRVESSARGVKARIQVEAVGGVGGRGAAIAPKDPPPAAVNPLGNINARAARADALGNLTTLTALTAATKAQAKAEAEAKAATAAAATENKAAAKAIADRAVSEKASLAATRRLQSATRDLAITMKSATKEHVLLASLDREEAAAQHALEVARAKGNVQLQEEIGLTLEANSVKRANVSTTVEQNIAENKLASGNAKAIARQRQLAKGAASSSLALAGLRGATLAAGGPFLAAAAAVTAFSKSVQGAAALETSLNVFGETTGATADQLRDAGEQAKALGRDITLPSVSASDAAQAFTELGKAGLSVEDSLAGARGVLQLATAAQIDNAQATELAASALNSFGLAGDQAVHVADLLTGAANEAQGSIADMGIALQQSSAAARQVGVGLEDTVTMLTLLARNGLRGSDAGTSLRTAFLRLIRPTKNAQEALDALQVNLRDAQGNVRPEIFADLGVALESLTRKQRDATLATIFGQDAFRAAAILAREGTAGFDRIGTAINKQGLAAALAGARTKGFNGQVEALKNGLSTLGLSLGQGVIPALGSVVDTLNEAVGATSDLSAAFGDLKNSVPGGGFLDKAFSFGNADAIRELRSGFQLIGQGETPALFGSSAEKVADLNAGLVRSIDNTKKLSKFIGTVQGPDEAVKLIEDLRDRLIGSGAAADETRQKLANVERLVIALGRAPTKLELDMFFKEGGLNPEKLDQIRQGLISNPFEVGVEVHVALDPFTREIDQAGKDVISSVRDSLKTALGPDVAQGFALDFHAAVQQSILDAPQIVIPIGLSIQQAGFRLGNFNEASVKAQIKGDVQAQIAALDDTISFLQKQLSRPVIKGNTKARRDFEDKLLAAQNERQSILDGLASDAEQRKRDAQAAADKAKQAIEDAHKATIDAFNLHVSQQQNRILAVTATKWLGDDLKATRQLGKILRAAIASGKLRADELATFRQQLIQNDADIRGILKDIRDRRKEQRDRLIESTELDIELASTNENKGAEIRARERLIRQLREAQKAAGRRSLEYKRLRNRIAEERKAIAELRKEQAKAGDEAKQMFFTFLQTQQGFAANLFGNLIGAPSAGGLVGNTSPAAAVATPGRGPSGPQGVLDRRAGTTPAQAVSAQASVSSAQEGRGISRGQASTLVHLMRQQIRILKDIHRDQGHTEARTRRIQARTSTETGSD